MNHSGVKVTADIHVGRAKMVTTVYTAGHARVAILDEYGYTLAALHFDSAADLHARALEIVKATETVPAGKEGGDPQSVEASEAVSRETGFSAEAGVEGARGSAREAVLASPPSLPAPLVDDEWTPGGNQGIGL